MEYYREPDSILRSRSLTKRLQQQIFSRLEIIRTLRLGPLAYASIPPVVLLSILNHFGIRIDGAFNLLSGRRAGAERRVSKG
jgi:hypothetical protein